MRGGAVEVAVVGPGVGAGGAGLVAAERGLGGEVCRLGEFVGGASGFAGECGELAEPVSVLRLVGELGVDADVLGESGAQGVEDVEERRDPADLGEVAAGVCGPGDACGEYGQGFGYGRGIASLGVVGDLDDVVESACGAVAGVDGVDRDGCGGGGGCGDGGAPGESVERRRSAARRR